MKKQHNGNTVAKIKRIIRYLKPYPVQTILSFVFSLLSTLVMLYIPVMAGKMIDAMVSAGNVDFDIITRYGAMIAVSAVAASLFQWLTNAVNNEIVYKVVRDMRSQAYKKLCSVPLSYIDSHPFGDTVSRIVSDIDVFADGLLLGFSQFFSGAVTIICTLCFMLSIQPLIALIVILLTPISIFTSRFIARKTHKRFVAQAEALGEETSLINECFSNHNLLKAFTGEKAMEARFDEVNNRLEKASRFANFFAAITNPVTRFVNSIVYACVALAGAFLCISTAGTAAVFSVGALSALLAYANKYTKPFNEISGVVIEMQNAFVCAERVFALIDQPSERDNPGAKELLASDGSIKFSDTSFSYDKSKELIAHLNLDVKSGMHVAIVGPTGCGKTTLINLLMRFYQTDGGDIYADGQPYSELTIQSIRRNFGMVLQDTWIKPGTVRENIALGEPDATDDKIIAAATLANAHSFIVKLKDGYDTVIDNNWLSQGQKQLLCISRVMLKMPPILILDEATSSIDTRTELIISRAFERLTQGKTSFIVAHRLSTIANSDLILVMKEGRIVEQGSHNQLLAKGGFYWELIHSIETV